MSLQITPGATGRTLRWCMAGDRSRCLNGVADALASDCRVHVVSLPGYAGTPDDGADFGHRRPALAAALPAGTLPVAGRWRHAWRLPLLPPGHPAPFRPAGTGRQHGPLRAGRRLACGAAAGTARPSATRSPAMRTTLTRFVMLFNQGDTRDALSYRR